MTALIRSLVSGSTLDMLSEKIREVPFRSIEQGCSGYEEAATHSRLQRLCLRMARRQFRVKIGPFTEAGVWLLLQVVLLSAESLQGGPSTSSHTLDEIDLLLQEVLL
jgi:hypothetical protein